jgi:succinate dehydrogenase flavin-adding protein (antitoxin of CptAB toxin-antitoxin module)
MKTENWREEFDKEFKLSANWDKFFGEGFVKQMNDLHNQQVDFIQSLLEKRDIEIVKWLNTNDYLQDEDCSDIINKLKNK